MEELGKEFMSSATELEKEYMLLKTVGDLEFIAFWEKKIQESNLFCSGSYLWVLELI